jgi:sugar/nucleoside kinase (ribokinase family)
MAGYLYKRVKGSLDFEEIGKFSAAISSLKLKTYGAFNGSIEEVMLLLEEKI